MRQPETVKQAQKVNKPRPAASAGRAPRGQWLLDRVARTFGRAAASLVLAVALLAALVALGLNALTATTWTSSTQIAPQLSLLDGGLGTNVYSLNIDGAKRFVDSQVALMTGDDVVGPVARSSGLSLDAFRERLRVNPGSSGATIVVSVRDRDPDRAQSLATALVASYGKVRAQQVRDLAQTPFDALTSQLDLERRRGLSNSELSNQLQRDIAGLYGAMAAGPSSVLTVVSSASTAKMTPRGTVTKPLIAFVGTAALAVAVLMALRSLGDRVLAAGDVPEGDRVTALGLLPRLHADEVAAAQAAALLSTSAAPPTCILVLSATPENLDEGAAAALARGLSSSGRPAHTVGLFGASHVATDLADSHDLLVVAGGWATQLPELLSALDSGTVICLAVKQGSHRPELEAALASLRQVTDLPVGVLLLPGRSLP